MKAARGKYSLIIKQPEHLRCRYCKKLMATQESKMVHERFCEDEKKELIGVSLGDVPSYVVMEE